MKRLIRITIPGAESASRDDSASLIEEFLWSIEALGEEEAARIAGVSVATLQRWRRSGSHRLRGDIRQRLQRHLRRVQRAREPEAA